MYVKLYLTEHLNWSKIILLNMCLLINGRIKNRIVLCLFFLTKMKVPAFFKLKDQQFSYIGTGYIITTSLHTLEF